MTLHHISLCMKLYYNNIYILFCLRCMIVIYDYYVICILRENNKNLKFYIHIIHTHCVYGLGFTVAFIYVKMIVYFGVSVFLKIELKMSQFEVSGRFSWLFPLFFLHPLRFSFLLYVFHLFYINKDNEYRPILTKIN